MAPRTVRLRTVTPCGYCFENWADCYDHIKPFAHGGKTEKSNLYPSCTRCNHLLHAKVFKSLDEKRAYVRETLKERKLWHSGHQMQRMREGLPPEEAMASVLLERVPFKAVGEKKPEKSRNKTSPNSLCIVCGQRFYTAIKYKIVCCKACSEVRWFNELFKIYQEKLAL